MMRLWTEQGLLVLGSVCLLLCASSAMAQDEPRPAPAQTNVNSSDRESSSQASSGNDPSWPVSTIADEFEAIYLQIALAVVREDTDTLQQLAQLLVQLATKSDDHALLAGFTRMIIAQELNDETQFAKAAGDVAACPRRTTEVATAVTQRMQLILSGLVVSTHAPWRNSLLESIGHKVWPAADALTIEIAKAYLPNISGYPDRASYMARLIERASALCNDVAYPVELRTGWSEGVRELCKLSIELHASHFQFAPLWTELRSYLDQYGANDKYSGHLFAVALQTLNRARIQRLEFDPLLIPERSWFENWHRVLTSNGSPKLQQRMAEAWDLYTHWTEETLPLGPVGLDQLRFDPRLRISIKGQYTDSVLTNVLSQLTSETGVSLRLAPETDPTLIIHGLISFAGPLYSAMRTLAESPEIQGEWVRTTEGYLLVSTKKNPPVATDWSRFWLIALNPMFAVLAAAYFWRRSLCRSK